MADVKASSGNTGTASKSATPTNTTSGPIPGGPWDSDPSWSILVLAGEVWPGIAKVEVSRKNKWDDKKGKGKHNGEREFSGADNAKVKIHVAIWEQSHYDLIKTLLPKIEPTPGKKKADAYPLQHPVANLRNVNAITIDEVKGPKEEKKGIWSLEIDGVESRPPEPRNASGKAGVVGGRSSTSDCKTEMANCQIMLEAYNRENNKLSGMIDDYNGRKAAGVQFDTQTDLQLKANISHQREAVKVFKAQVDSQAAKLRTMGCIGISNPSVGAGTQTGSVGDTTTSGAGNWGPK